MDIIDVIEFVTPFYQKRDMMHDISHIKRIYNKAICIKNKLELDADREVLFLGCYFHGIIRSYGAEVRDFLQKKSIDKEKAEKVIQCAMESHVQAIPVTIEGKIAHDAHLLEGGKFFLITKTLVTGTIKGQTLVETVKYLENNVMNAGICCFAQNQEELLAAKNIAREFVEEMKQTLQQNIQILV